MQMIEDTFDDFYIEWDEPEQFLFGSRKEKWFICSKNPINGLYYFLDPNGRVGVPQDFLNYYFESEELALGTIVVYKMKWSRKGRSKMNKTVLTQSEPLFE